MANKKEDRKRKEKKEYSKKKRVPLIGAESGQVVSVIYKVFNFASRQFEPKEVTAFVKDKTRMMYIVILGDYYTDDGMKYQYFRRYINPSQIIAVKKIDDKLDNLKFNNEHEFIMYILSKEDEISKSKKYGK